jgi:hypothetical protein
MSTITEEINNTTSVEETNDEIKTKFFEYAKLYQRVIKHGDINTVKKVGRKPVSPEHKKEVYKRWIDNRAEKRREQAIAEGRNPNRGRPRKIPLITYPPSVQVN